MFDLDPAKLLVLAILAMVVLGPERLPHAARSVGKFIGQVKTMSGSFQTEVRDAFGEDGETIVTAISEYRPNQVRRQVRRAVTSTISTMPTAANQPNGGVAGRQVREASPGPGVSGVTGLNGTESTALPSSVPDDPSYN